MAEEHTRDLERTAEDDIVSHEEDELKPRPYLIILHGADRNKLCHLHGEAVTIGRSEEADITLEDDRISRLHCTITLLDDVITVDDNGSKNGTFVNGERITESMPIGPDTLVRIGHTVFRIEYKTSREIDFENQLFIAATTDPLTKVPNRRMFMEQAHTEIVHSKREEAPLFLLMVDVDHFKSINDNYGHRVGDLILKNIAIVLKECKREEDIICRYGGEEFLILPRKINFEDARALADRIRLTVEGYPFNHKGENLLVTVSIGLAQSAPEDTIETLIDRADEAMYRAKERGRNRVELPSED